MLFVAILITFIVSHGAKVALIVQTSKLGVVCLQNTVFLLLTAVIHNFYKTIISKLDNKSFGLKETSRINSFVFRFISVLANLIMTVMLLVLYMYTENRAYARTFKTGFG